MRTILAIVVLVASLTACGNREKEQALAQQQALIKVKDSLRLDSFKRVEVEQKAATAEQQRLVELAAARAAGKNSANRSSSNYSSRGSSTSSSAGSTTAASKKGWSSAAKGTAIGAAAGAVGGVLIDKKDGRGAVIGGLAGAGAGYAIGRAEDRKSGRVQPRN